MLIKKPIQIIAALLALLMLTFTGCTEKNNNAKVEANKTPWAVTEYDSAEIMSDDGKFILNKPYREHLKGVLCFGR